jgi:hypothetical protein
VGAGGNRRPRADGKEHEAQDDAAALPDTEEVEKMTGVPKASEELSQM